MLVSLRLLVCGGWCLVSARLDGECLDGWWSIVPGSVCEETDIWVSGPEQKDPPQCQWALSSQLTVPLEQGRRKKREEKFAASSGSLSSQAGTLVSSPPAFGHRTPGSSAFGLWNLHQWPPRGSQDLGSSQAAVLSASLVLRPLDLDWATTSFSPSLQMA